VVLIFAALSMPAISSQPVQSAAAEISANPQTAQLPYFIGRTLLRMAMAYALAVLIGVAWGIAAGLSERAAKFMIPLLDIFQSVPVLGYLPAALLFFIAIAPGEVGIEAAAIVLILTSEVWAIAFGVYQGVRSIPREYKEAAAAFGVRGWGYISKVVLPAIFPNFITSSILAWGGGWYFLVACEFMTFGNQVYALPGIGYYLASSVYGQAYNLASALFGLAVFIALVYSINRLIWRPLMSYADVYKFEALAVPGIAPPPRRALLPGALRFMTREEEVLALSVAKERRYLTRHLPSLHLPRVKLTRMIARLGKLATAVAIAASLIVTGLVIAWIVASLPVVSAQLAANPEAYSLPYFALRSLARIGIAFLLALGWTLVVGIAVARSKRLFDALLPLFDVAQAVPALALFPFIITIVINFFGASAPGLELASILLLMTGAQWYLLFNIIGAVKAIPGDVMQAAQAFGLRGWAFTRKIIIPSIFPGIVIGSIQAFGGAWNASIVSEYIYWGAIGQPYTVPGLGYFLDKSAAAGNTVLMVLTLVIMTSVILILNRTLWAWLFKRSERYKFEA